MISAGDHLDASGKKLLSRPGGDSFTPGGVFSIGDDAIEGVFRDESWHGLLDRLAARTAEYIADKENLNRHALLRVFYRPGFSDDGYLDLAGIRQFIFDLMSKFLGQIVTGFIR